MCAQFLGHDSDGEGGADDNDVAAVDRQIMDSRPIHAQISPEPEPAPAPAPAKWHFHFGEGKLKTICMTRTRGLRGPPPARLRGKWHNKGWVPVDMINYSNIN